MKKGSANNDAFAEEALRVHQLHHPNVIRLLATCLTSEPSMLIFEFMHVGDLKSFLRDAAGGDGMIRAGLVLFCVGTEILSCRDRIVAFDVDRTTRGIWVRVSTGESVLASGSGGAKCAAECSVCGEDWRFRFVDDDDHDDDEYDVKDQ